MGDAGYFDDRGAFLVLRPRGPSRADGRRADVSGPLRGDFQLAPGRLPQRPGRRRPGRPAAAGDHPGAEAGPNAQRASPGGLAGRDSAAGPDHPLTAAIDDFLSIRPFRWTFATTPRFFARSWPSGRTRKQGICDCGGKTRKGAKSSWRNQAKSHFPRGNTDLTNPLFAPASASPCNPTENFVPGREKPRGEPPRNNAERPGKLRRQGRHRPSRAAASGRGRGRACRGARGFGRRSRPRPRCRWSGCGSRR